MEFLNTANHTQKMTNLHLCLVLSTSASDILLGQWQCQCGAEINFHFDGQIKFFEEGSVPIIKPAREVRGPEGPAR